MKIRDIDNFALFETINTIKEITAFKGLTLSDVDGVFVGLYGEHELNNDSYNESLAAKTLSMLYCDKWNNLSNIESGINYTGATYQKKRSVTGTRKGTEETVNASVPYNTTEYTNTDKTTYTPDIVNEDVETESITDFSNHGIKNIIEYLTTNNTIDTIFNDVIRYLGTIIY